jgi:hypothetical protein
MRTWLIVVVGLALASALLTRLGDMLWSPGIWPTPGIRTFVQKTIASLIATAPVALLLGFWALRIKNFARGCWRTGWLGAALLSLVVTAYQLYELGSSPVVWGGKIPPMPHVAGLLPYIAALGFGLGCELGNLRSRTPGLRRGPRSASSAARNEAESHSRRNDR